MKRVRYSLLTLSITSLISLSAAISVGPSGSGVLTFDTQPTASEWSTLSGTGVPGDYSDTATLDAQVQTLSAGDITATLGSSGTQPPSANAIARRNTNNLNLQSRPNGAGYIALLATLQNDTGETASFVNVSYTFGLDVAADASAVEEIPGFRAFYSLTGAAGSWQPIPAFSTGTPGELSASLNVGSWANGASLYLLWIDDDAEAATTAPNVEGAYTIDNFEAKASAGREPLLSTFTFSPLGFNAQITDGAAPRTINQASLAVTLNGAAITPQITKTGDLYDLTLTGAALPEGSTNVVQFTYADNGNPPRTNTISRTFVVAPYTIIPASYAVTGVDTTKPGFKARIHQIPVARGPGDQNSIANAERQLADAILDLATGQPYPNEADLSLAVNGLFEVPGVINWSQDAPTAIGNFSEASTPPAPDDPIPGIPGVSFSTDNIAAEILTFLDLKAGYYRMGVNSDDGFKVTVGPNPRDVFALVLGSFNTGRGVADTVFDFVVEADGIYPFRLAWWEGGSDAAVEWFTVDSAGGRHLINATSDPASIKAYREGPAAPVFVKSASPFPFVTNALPNAVINIVLSDSATQVQPGTVQLFFDGQSVNATVTKPAGSPDTTITYDPPGNLEPEAIIPIRLVYGDNASPSVVRTNEYTIQIKPVVLVGIDETTVWRYENNGLDLGTAWKEKDFNDSAWPQGPALLAAESGATAEPIRTPIVRSSPEGVQIVTDYFRTHFNFTGNPAAVQLLLNHVVDDGVVFYLNGIEVHRFGAAANVVVTNGTFFSGHENVYEGPFAISSSSLVQGDNVLAAEVHQSDLGSSDSVFGAELLQMTLTNVPPTTVDSITPVPDATNVKPDAPIEIVLVDGTRQILTNSIQLTVNGQPVTPVISKPAGGISTRITYNAPTNYPPDALVAVKLTFSDSATPANVTTRDFSFRVEPTYDVIFGIDEQKTWKYMNTGQNLGTAWKEKNFDDSSWPEGPALLAAETGATVEPIRTELVRQSPEGAQIVTDYFRTHFNFTGDPATARLRIRHVVDDGVVFYLNGTEVHRFGLAEGVPFDNGTFFGGHENAYAGPFDIPTGSLVQGDNVLAAEVHQSDLGSSDLVFGAELQLVTSAPPAEQPAFSSVTRSQGNLVLEWAGGGVLQSSETATGGWTDVPNSTSPYTSPISGNTRFFRIRQ